MMKEALVRLYTRIIHVLLRAIQWYRQGKLKHSISAIFQPWALTFHEHLEAIKEDSIRLDNLSDMATKAELRDTHTKIIEALERLGRNEVGTADYAVREQDTGGHDQTWF